MIAAATMTSKGQVTVPVRIRERLGLERGDQLVFVEEQGRFYVENATGLAFTRVREAFKDEAQRADLTSQDDVVSMVKNIRRERWEASHASDA